MQYDMRASVDRQIIYNDLLLIFRSPMTRGDEAPRFIHSAGRRPSPRPAEGGAQKNSRAFREEKAKELGYRRHTTPTTSDVDFSTHGGDKHILFRLTFNLHRRQAPMARLSGLQREVLSLYRKCLRETRRKPMVNTLPNTNFSAR